MEVEVSEEDTVFGVYAKWGDEVRYSVADAGARSRWSVGKSSFYSGFVMDVELEV